MNMVVRQFPPSESCRMRVILLSRYGTYAFCGAKRRQMGGGPWGGGGAGGGGWGAVGLTVPSASAEMTLPRADSDLLMFLASSNTAPSAPVLLTWGPRLRPQ